MNEELREQIMATLRPLLSENAADKMEMLLKMGHTTIKKMLSDAGVFCDDNRKRKYGYAKEEGVGLGKLDFSKKAEKGMASLYEINTYKSMYLIDGVAHNPENFGNFLYGAACEALGFSLLKTTVVWLFSIKKVRGWATAEWRNSA